MEWLKDFFLHRITLRVLYIIAAYSTSHAVALVGGPDVQAFLSHIGVKIQIVDPDLLKTWITGTLLVGGEFVFHFVHSKFVLPHVSNPTSGEKI